MRSPIVSNHLLSNIKGFPPPSTNPVIPLDILPFYLDYHGYVSIGMDDFGRLIVQPRSALQLEEAVKAAHSGD